jgi:hypothetical protein
VAAVVAEQPLALLFFFWFVFCWFSRVVLSSKGRLALRRPINGADSFAEFSKVFQDPRHRKPPARGLFGVIHSIQQLFVQLFERVPAEAASVLLLAAAPL